jgi:hypothetical protein
MSDIEPVRFDMVDCLSRDPYFCGSQLARRREKKGQTPEQQADDLGITLQRLEFLALSRMPQGRADLEAIAWQLEMEPGTLADVLDGSQGGKATLRRSNGPRIESALPCGDD